MSYKIKDKEHIVWLAMKQRCYKKTDRQYHYYGGRGITVCERWLESYKNFISDMGHRPTDLHTIDRIDTNGNYEPGNCKWATRAEQSRNKSNNILITHEGQTMCAKDWSVKLGICDQTIYNRMKKGLSAEVVLCKGRRVKPKPIRIKPLRPRGLGLSDYKGVTWHKRGKRWQAGLWDNSKFKYLGMYKSETEAAAKVNEFLRNRQSNHYEKSVP